MQYDFLQLVISSPLIHALSDPSQAPTGISNLGPQIERQTTYQLSYPSPWCADVSICFVGYCDAGYYCNRGATDRVPVYPDSSFPLNGPCPEGQYCPQGTTAPIDCPAGTFRNATGLLVHLGAAHKSLLLHDFQGRPPRFYQNLKGYLCGVGIGGRGLFLNSDAL